MAGDPRRGRVRRTVGTVVASLLALAPAVVAGVWGVGHAPRVVDLLSGAAWLASPGSGLVSLVDGVSAQVAVTLRLPAADRDATVVQDRDAAYVVRAGTVARIDAATWTLGRAVALTDEDRRLTVLPGRGDRTAGDAPAADAPLWVLDGRTVRVLDGRTLDVRATADLPLDGRVRGVVDERGDLWAGDDDHVVRVRLEHGGLRTTPADDDGGGDLVLVQGRAVLVDVARGAVRPLDRPRGVTCAQARSDARGVPVVGSTTSPEVYTAAGGTLRVTATDGGGCATVARVGGRNAEVAALAQVDGYVVATDRRTGAATVVDVRGGATQTLALTDPGHRVELVVRGAAVLWNDLDGHRSGLLELSGDVWRSVGVEKFDPATGVGAQVVRTSATAPGAPTGPRGDFDVETLAPDRELYAPGAPAVLVPEVSGEPTADEVWWWRFEDLRTGALEDFETPGVPLRFAALPDVGEYAVTLVVLRDGATATATTTLRVVAWCPLTVSTTQVDLATDPSVEVTVDPACPVAQSITVQHAPWLAAGTTGDFAPGSPGTVTLRAVADPPAPGPVAGALVLEVTGHPESQVRVDVVGATG